MRHSREQAQKTYDRRTHNDKKAAAMELARTVAEDFVPRERAKEADLPAPSTAHRKFKPGDFVACVEEGSSEKKPRLLVGRVLFYLNDQELSLQWYSRKMANAYSPSFDGKQWVESEPALAAVEMSRLKGKPDFLSLRTSVRAVYKALGH